MRDDQIEYNGQEIDWNFKNTVMYTSITLAGFGILIGWFKLARLWMSLV